MNKLYCVKVKFRGLLLECRNFWNESECNSYLSELLAHGIECRLVEDNLIHKIYTSVD